MSVGLNLTKCQESFLGTPISILVPKSVVHEVVPELLMWYTRAVRKVSSHFEYLKNRSRGADVTWQPVRGDLTAHA